MSTLPVANLRDMMWEDVDAVLVIEQHVHAHPWTRGNFNDSLANGYLCKVYEAANSIVGYVVLMPALDEAHLLDISIAAAYQRMGLGKKLLHEMLSLAREMKFARVLLEVRASNVAALALYRKRGFGQIGLRRGYYPAAEGREDAIVMEYVLQ